MMKPSHLPKRGKKILIAKLYIDKTTITVTENDFGLSIKATKDKMNEFDTVIELEVKEITMNS